MLQAPSRIQLSPKFKKDDKVIVKPYGEVSIVENYNPQTKEYCLNGGRAAFYRREEFLEPYIEPKIFKPKYKVDDIVLYKNKLKVVDEILSNGQYIVTTLNGQSPLWLYEDRLEPTKLGALDKCIMQLQEASKDIEKKLENLSRFLINE